MNIIYCELFSLLNLVSEANTETARTLMPSNQLPAWVSSISQHSWNRNRLSHGGRTAQRHKSRYAVPSSTTGNAPPTLAQFKQAQRVYTFVAHALQGHRNSASGNFELELDRSTYVALLPTVWSILSSDDADRGEDGEDGVLNALLEHATKLSSSNSVKGAATEFVARLVLVRPILGSIHYTCPHSSATWFDFVRAASVRKNVWRRVSV